MIILPANITLFIQNTKKKTPKYAIIPTKKIVNSQKKQK